MKKFVSVLLALAMTLALSVSALAASGTNNDNGKITINNAVVGQTYTIYQILKLESYNTDSGAYSYKATDAWKSFVEGATVKNIYMSTDTQGYVTWVKDADVAAFAKLAQAYAVEHKIANQGNKVAAAAGDEKTTTVEFTDLNLGYYLLDSSMGTLCSLNTTHTEVVIQEKNAEPTNVKTVEEDSTPGVYGEKNDADIGQTVNFKSTITAQPGAENYVFEDTMSAGLTYKNDAKVYTDENMTTELDAKHYTVNNNPGGKTFTITFNQNYLNTITAATKLYVKYSATLNENAKVGLDGNSNKSTLKYGDATNTKSTPDSETITYTWDLDVLKYANGDESKVLENAQFVLLNKTKDKVATVVNGKLTDWVNVPAEGEDGTITWPENTVLTTGKDGKIAIDGLDSDTYYLREVKAPAGYNILNGDVEVKITGATKGENDTLTYATVVAKVENQSGTELPSTGGMGTTIFYVLGGVLMAGAFVLLVVRKRMRTE